MKIIYLNAGNVVLYAGDSIELHGTFAAGPSGAQDPSTTTGNATVAVVDNLPADFAGGLYTFDPATRAFALTTAGQQRAAAILADAVAVQVARIAADVDAIFDDVVGKRATEYQAALDDAQAYKAAGYSGTVPPGVQSWADAMAYQSWTTQQAADNIIATGAGWLQAQAAMRAARLLRKQQCLSATTLADVAAVAAQWAGFVNGIRQQLGV